MSHDTELTAGQQLVQSAAEVLYACATSDNRRLADFRAEAYLAAEAAFRALYLAVYGDATEQTWEIVRETVSDLGPRELFGRVEGPGGVDSYHRGALLEVAERCPDCDQGWVRTEDFSARRCGACDGDGFRAVPAGLAAVIRPSRHDWQWQGW